MKTILVQGVKVTLKREENNDRDIMGWRRGKKFHPFGNLLSLQFNDDSSLQTERRGTVSTRTSYKVIPHQLIN